MEWLKQLLGEELFNQLFPKDSDNLKKVTEKIGNKKMIEDDGKLVPQSRVKELTDKKTELENQLKTASDNLTKVQADYDKIKTEKDKGKSTVDEQIASLTKTITDLQTELKNKDQLGVVNNKRTLVESQFRLLKANDQYLQTLVREFELKHPLDKLEIENGKIKDAENLFKPFQEDYKPLFGVVQKKGFEHKDGNDPGAGDFFTMDEIKAMDQSTVKANLEKVNKSIEYHDKQGN